MKYHAYIGITPESGALLQGRRNAKTPLLRAGSWSWVRSLTITYFHTGNPHYHRRGVVSRSCSGWEGVGPTRYGHQA